MDHTLSEQIDSAFDVTPHPNESNIFIEDSQWYVFIHFSIKDELINKSWQELDEYFVLYNYEVLHFMTPEAYQYYLPAFLKVGMLHMSDSNILPSAIISSLYPNHSAEKMHELQSRIDRLNTHQKIVINKFIRLFASAHIDYFIYDMESINLVETIKFWDNVAYEVKQ